MNDHSTDKIKNQALWMLDERVAECVAKADLIRQTAPTDIDRIYQLLLVVNHMTSAVKHLQEPIKDGVGSGFFQYSILIDKI
jgi:hypothetical protein